MSTQQLTMVPAGRPAASPIQKRQAVITGTGLLTPLGRTPSKTWDALLSGHFITNHSRAAGEFDNASPRVIQMARRVAEQAMSEAGWSPRDNFATVVGTSKG